jgi:hypothetical protein
MLLLLLAVPALFGSGVEMNVQNAQLESVNR